jgi:hypothetical protein
MAMAFSPSGCLTFLPLGLCSSVWSLFPTVSAWLAPHSPDTPSPRRPVLQHVWKFDVICLAAHCLSPALTDHISCTRSAHH